MVRIIDTSMGKDREYDSVQNAVSDALTPLAYSYEGKMEKLEAQIEKLQELVARLVENIYGDSQSRYNKSDQLKDILGYGYEVEEL